MQKNPRPIIFRSFAFCFVLLWQTLTFGATFDDTFINPGPVVEVFESASGQPLFGLRKIIQDKSGFLWLATSDGLWRFNGFDLKVFRFNTDKPKGLNHNNVWTLLQDEQGFIWLVTDGGGLSRFSPKSEQFDHFTYDKNDVSTLDSNKAISLALAPDGKLWVGTAHGINLFDRKTLTNQRYNAQLLASNPDVSERISHIYQDSQQRLWFSVHRKGLFMVRPDTKTIRHFQHDKNDDRTLLSDYIGKIYENTDGDIWLGSNFGINKYDSVKQDFIRLPLPLAQSNAASAVSVESLFEDSEKRLWYGTDSIGAGVLWPDSKTLTQLNQKSILPDTLSGMWIKDIMQDRSGTLWFASISGGLFKLSSQSLLFKNIAVAPSSERKILSVFVDSSGVLWVGTDKSLYRYDDKSQQLELAAKDIGIVSAIAQDSDHTLVLNVGNRGVFTYNWQGQKLTAYGGIENNEPPKPPSTALYRSSIDSDGALWLGLFRRENFPDGLYKFDKQTGQYQQQAKGMTVTAILPLSQNVIIGTAMQGLKVLNRSTSQVHSVVEQNHDISRIRSLYQDSEKRIWAGTSNAGLVQLDTQGVPLTFYNQTHGLPSNHVKSIVAGNDESLWLGTGKGVVRFDPTTKQVTVLNQNNGFFTDTDSLNKSAVMPSGEIIMANDKGLVRFSPPHVTAQATVKPHNRPILLSDFTLYNLPVNEQAKGPPKRIINNFDDLTLPYQHNWFSLSFASSHYNQSTDHRYAYQMVGLTEQWITTDTDKRIVTFTSLPAGEYQLKVKSGFSDNQWNNDIRTLKIVVTPPWWATTVAYVIYGILTVALLLSINMYRTRQLQQRAKKLEMGILQRTVQLKERADTIAVLLAEKNQLLDYKARFFANISHEFKTPLTLILTPLSLLSAALPVADFNQKVSMMQRNGQRLLQMIEQLLALSKIEAAHDEALHHYSLKATLDVLLTSFQPLTDSKNLSLHNPPFSDVIVSLQADSLEIILTNLISNAIKYTPNQGNITITVHSSSSTVTILVKDSGIGISEQNQQVIFNRFTRANEHHDQHIPGAGIGLALVKELVESHNGLLSVESELNQGSTFSVTLPISTDQTIKTEQIMSLTSTSQSEIDVLLNATPENLPVVVAQFDDETKPTVLLIDDNHDMLALLQDTLAGHYHCLASECGEKGLQLATEHLPDLIISDVMMPGLSGFDVVRRLKEAEMTSHIPVVLLTAKGDVQSRIKGWTEKADEYLEKPFNAIELLTRIDNLLSIRHLLRQRYQRIFAEPQTVKTAKAQPNEVHQAFINKLNDCLEQKSADETFDVVQLVAEMAMSHSQFGRKVRALLDLTPKESIRNFRLKKAAELLSQGHSASMVFHQVGFTSHSYFSQCFKAQFNCLPSQYDQRG